MTTITQCCGNPKLRLEELITYSAFVDEATGNLMTSNFSDNEIIDIYCISCNKHFKQDAFNSIEFN